MEKCNNHDRHEKDISKNTEMIKTLSLIVEKINTTLISLERRIDDTSKIANSIYEISTSLQLYSQKIDYLTITMEKRMDNIENCQSKQEERINEIERKPGNLALKIAGIIGGLCLTTLIGWFIGKL